MAGFSNFLKSRSETKNVAYHPVPNRDTETDSDTDEICKHAATLQNVKQQTKRHEVIEMDRLNSSRTTSNNIISSGQNHVNVAKPKMSKTVIICFCASLIAVLGIVLVFSIALPCLYNHGENDTVLNIGYNQTADWTRTFRDWGSESCIRLVDVDDDGKQDILVGMAMAANFKDFASKATLKEFCRKKGLQTPCVGALVALRGYDGKELWRVPLCAEPFEINCDRIDINQDGKKDCIAAGRIATLVAVNPKNGEVFWHGDNRVLVHDWNIYQPLIIPDFDGDHIEDVLIAHGGDPRYPPELQKRNASRLIVLSGQTGKMIGNRYMEIPEDKETYMSPVLHTRKDGSRYVLFGSGGETVSGSLFAISLTDLYRFIFKLNSNKLPPKSLRLKVATKPWEKNITQDGVIEIFRSSVKGIMVPPVLACVNGDDVKDILVSAYNGTMALYDGETLQQIWQKKFIGYESYSTPAPGYFNDDGIIDFMTHWSLGVWPHYNSSLTVIQDGKDGSILWELKTGKYEMSSDLVVKTKEKNLDVFIFRVQGREAVENASHGVLHGVTPQRKPGEVSDATQMKYKRYNQYYRTKELRKRADDKTKNGPHRPICDENARQALTTEIFMVSRRNKKQLIRVATSQAEKYHYNLTEADRKILSDAVQAKYGKEHPSSGSSSFTLPPTHKTVAKRDSSFCTFLEPAERTTGAVGDVDGDGTLDIIMLFGSGGLIRDETGSYIRMKFLTKILKINLSNKVDKQHVIQIHPNNFSKLNNHMDFNFEFLLAKKQQWTGYMGTGDSIYEAL